MLTAKDHAQIGWRLLPGICDSFSKLEERFLRECKSKNIDEYKLRIYFTHLLMLTDELKEEYQRLIELILEE